MRGNIRKLRFDFANLHSKRDFRLYLEELQKHQKGKCKYCESKLYKEEKVEYAYPTWYWDEDGPCYGLPRYFIDREWSYHVDHVIPLAKGGTNSFDNLVLACGKCNMQKGARLEWTPTS